MMSKEGTCGRRLGSATAAPVTRGLSLVELMVGITVGLFIVAAATVLVSGQLGENRRLMLDSQLQQDLRATADIITRELRRINANRPAERLIAHPTLPAKENAMAILMTPKAASAAYSSVEFAYERDSIEFGPWGFQLDAGAGVIRTQLGGVSWQDLTDRNAMQVTSFTIGLEREPGQELPCPNLCPSGDTTCWPVLQVLNYVVNITAEARTDPSIVRRVRSVARARNDWVEFRTTGSAGNKPACPS